MNDAELIALAAIVNANCVEITAQNDYRKAFNEVPMYSSYMDDGALEKLKDEVKRREQCRKEPK